MPGAAGRARSLRPVLFLVWIPEQPCSVALSGGELTGEYPNGAAPGPCPLLAGCWPCGGLESPGPMVGAGA